MGTADETTRVTAHGAGAQAERLERTRSEALDAILGAPIPVLDKGFVRPVDYLGNEAAIVRAARISYGKGTKSVSEDAGLLRYLFSHRHTTPFEMCELVLHIRIPMDAWRQMIRTRTASVNEYSTRYSEAIDDKQRTLPGQWRLQSSANKQGSGGLLDADAGEWLSGRELELHLLAEEVYQERLAKGVAREQARKDLPLSTYTEAYWKIDLHNLLHFLGLRLDPHAQLEIRQFAGAIAEVVRVWVPTVWQAFVDYRLEALTLSGPEIRMLVAGTQVIARGVFEAVSFPPLDDQDTDRRTRAKLVEVLVAMTAAEGPVALGARELREFAAKLDRLNQSQLVVEAVRELAERRAPKRAAGAP